MDEVKETDFKKVLLGMDMQLKELGSALSDRESLTKDVLQEVVNELHDIKEKLENLSKSPKFSKN